MTKLQELEQCFLNGYNYNMKFVAILVELPEGEQELIVNNKRAIMNKLNYIKTAYNDDLELKNSDGKVKIIDFTCGNSLTSIEEDLFY